MARTKGWTWDVPYCVACKRHIRLADQILLLSLSSFAAAVLLGAAAGVQVHEQLLGVSVGLTTMALCLVVAGRAWRQGNKNRPVNCERMTRSVIYLGSDGPCHSFEIKSRFYAADFVRANHRKLVNLSPQVASILKGTSFGDHQVPRRIFRNRL